MSTGPHLDYRMTIGSRYVNPLTITAPSKAGISDADRAAFEAAKIGCLSLINRRLPHNGSYVVEISVQAPAEVTSVNNPRDEGHDRS